MDLDDDLVDPKGVGTRLGQVDPVVVPIERDQHLRLAKQLDRVPEHRVDITIVQLDAALAGQGAGASEDHINHPLLLLEGAG